MAQKRQVTSKILNTEKFCPTSKRKRLQGSCKFERNTKMYFLDSF